MRPHITARAERNSARGKMSESISKKSLTIEGALADGKAPTNGRILATKQRLAIFDRNHCFEGRKRKHLKVVSRQSLVQLLELALKYVDFVLVDTVETVEPDPIEPERHSVDVNRSTLNFGGLGRHGRIEVSGESIERLIPEANDMVVALLQRV